MVIFTVSQEVIDYTRQSVSESDIVWIFRTIKLANITVICIDQLASFILESSS